jgi:hypothetical protein
MPMDPSPARPLNRLEKRLARFLYGFDGGVLIVSRQVPAEPQSVLDAVGRVVVHAPFDLRLMDSRGGHPLEGGELIFGFVRYNSALASADSTTFRGHLTQIFIRTLELALRSAPGGTVIEVRGDLDREVGLGVRGYLYAAMVLGALVGFGAGWTLAARWLGMGPEAISRIAAGGVLAGMPLILVPYRWYCRWAVRLARESLEEMLQAVENDVSPVRPLP